MAADIFLKLDTVNGESKDSQHKDEIEILAWNWSETQTGSASRGGGSGTGKLILACATGQHIPKAAMAMRKAGGDQKEYLKITLEDVMVSSYSTSGAGGGESPTESISLAFGKITFEYFEQDNKGTTTSSGKAGWDVKQNKQV
jgi:type VI secretion system secreted protein Hcp